MSLGPHFTRCCPEHAVTQENRRLTYRPPIERNIAKCLEEGRLSGEAGSVNTGSDLKYSGAGAWGNCQFVRSRANVWQ